MYIYLVDKQGRIFPVHFTNKYIPIELQHPQYFILVVPMIFSSWASLIHNSWGDKICQSALVDMYVCILCVIRIRHLGEQQLGHLPQSNFQPCLKLGIWWIYRLLGLVEKCQSIPKYNQLIKQRSNFFSTGFHDC